jgi:hypothetical protein
MSCSSANGVHDMVAIENADDGIDFRAPLEEFLPVTLNETAGDDDPPPRPPLVCAEVPAR